ncbi:hypothetical protein [Pedobacter agri]|uniref:hypothetical protein n=1 Tax=Pedobacter agri TaxID=454586 RepID=UPI0027824B28|nr:hypothetical protein [Pedobacter agri]MDQ1140180.1 hypothetical protein [Pedobacter agri]
MKTIFYGMVIFLASLSYGCKNGHNNLSLNTIDTKTEYKFIAEYDEDKTDKLEKYLDSALNNELPLDQNIDLFVNLNGTEKFNLKAQNSKLEILFDKRNSSLAGYMKVKKLAQGIQKKLMEK